MRLITLYIIRKFNVRIAVKNIDTLPIKGSNTIVAFLVLRAFPM